MPSEAQARITINKMLEEAGWRFLPDAQGRRENIICEHRVTRRAFSPSQDLGKDIEHAPNGFVDYVHLNTDQRPVAVTEAKREGIDPLTGRQVRRTPCSRCQSLRFVVTAFSGGARGIDRLSAIASAA